MPPAIADITAPIPLVLSESGYPTSVMLAPIFFNGSARRHRLVVRGGYVVAAACLAYSVMLGVCVTALPVTKPGDTTRPASNVTNAGTTANPTPRIAKAAPQVARPVAVPVPKVLADNAVTEGAPLVLRLAVPATPRPAPPKPLITTRPAPTSRPHHDNNAPHLTKVSATPVASAAAAPPTKTSKRAAK